MTPDRDLSGKVVLVVEDEPITGLWLADGLGDAGLQVRGPLMTCEAALGYLEGDGNDADAAVLDFGLSDGSGMKVARALRQRNLPFVVFSGDARRYAAHWAELGEPPIVEKPASPADVVAALRVACARRGA